jgi:hypothetical protein
VYPVVKNVMLASADQVTEWGQMFLRCVQAGPQGQLPFQDAPASAAQSARVH